MMNWRTRYGGMLLCAALDPALVVAPVPDAPVVEAPPEPVTAVDGAADQRPVEAPAALLFTGFVFAVVPRLFEYWIVPLGCEWFGVVCVCDGPAWV
jgi:hypothetical protein